MVKVTYYRKKHRLCVNGHAHSGEVGHDLVCASVSMLVYTLASFVSSMASAGQVKAKCVKLAEGDARIGVKVDGVYDAAVMLAFDAICGGFALLARDYPEFIKYEIMEY
jgi:uncharacterized protein YsxB (DUF464 family)